MQIQTIMKLIWTAVSSQLCRSCPPAESWSSSKHMPVLQRSYLFIFRFVVPASCVMQWYVQNVSLQVHFTLCIAVDNYWSCKLVMSREVLVEANRRIIDSNIVPVWYRYCSNTVQLQHTVATVSGRASGAVTAVSIVSAPPASPSYIVF
jgi:hypothetical protein